jgi:hypothetical protein
MHKTLKQTRAASGSSLPVWIKRADAIRAVANYDLERVEVTTNDDGLRLVFVLTPVRGISREYLAPPLKFEHFSEAKIKAVECLVRHGVLEADAQLFYADAFQRAGFI